MGGAGRRRGKDEDEEPEKPQPEPKEEEKKVVEKKSLDFLMSNFGARKSFLDPALFTTKKEDATPEERRS